MTVHAQVGRFAISKFCVAQGELKEPKEDWKGKVRERKRRVNTLQKPCKLYEPNAIFTSTNFITTNLKEQKDLTLLCPHTILSMNPLQNTEKRTVFLNVHFFFSVKGGTIAVNSVFIVTSFMFSIQQIHKNAFCMKIE